MVRLAKIVVFSFLFLLLVSLTVAAPGASTKTIDHSFKKVPDINTLKVLSDSEARLSEGTPNNPMVFTDRSGTTFDKSVLVLSTLPDKASKRVANIDGIPFDLKVLNE